MGKTLERLSSSRALAALLAAALVLGLLMGVAGPPRQAFADEGTVTKVGAVDTITEYGYTQNTCYMELNGLIAFCCQHFKPTPNEGAAASVVESPVDNDLMRKVCYYGKFGPADTGELSLVQTACALSNANGEDITLTGRDALAKVADLPTPPDTFVLTKWTTGTATQNLVTWTYKPDGYIDLQKVSANPSLSDGISAYSLEGAVYGVYKDAACTDLAAELETDAEGYAKSGKLPEGTYWVKETKAPEGYALAPSVVKVDVSADKTTRVNGDKVLDAPQNDPADMIIGKIDAETSKNLPQGSASLAGAEYTVKYYDGLYDEASLPAKATRTWVLKTDENGTTGILSAQADPDTYFVSGDELYTSSFGIATLPLGTVTVQETKAPAGYLLGTNGNAPLHLQQIKSVGDAETVETYNAPTDSEQVVRGDFDFNKVNGQNMARLANVAFSVSSDVTGESHVVVTDANGYASTAAAWNAHSANTNANDAAVTVGPDGKTSVDESKLDPAAGVWFGTSAPDDGKGALPYDTYTVTELPGKANADLELVSFKVTISRNAATVNLGTVDDNPLTPPAIRTTATDKASGSHEAQASSRTVIVDQVAYEGLTPGKTYTVEGTLMDKATGQALTVDGKVVRASKTFVPERAVGTVEVSFELDSSALAGKTTVVFEDVQSDGKSVAVHADITDEGQSVSFVGIGTTAADKADGDKEIEAEKGQTIVDTVSYTGLVPGKEYTVVGTLMDKATGRAITEEGKAVAAAKTFVPESPDGAVEVEFSVDGSTLAGKSVVVFEDLLRDGRTVAQHADIDDEGQTVKVKAVPEEPEVPRETERAGYDKTGNLLEGAAPAAGAIACAAVAAAAYGIRQRRLAGAEPEDEG